MHVGTLLPGGWLLTTMRMGGLSRNRTVSFRQMVHWDCLKRLHNRTLRASLQGFSQGRRRLFRHIN